MAKTHQRKTKKKSHRRDYSRKQATRKRTRKSVGARKRTPVKRRKRSQGRKVVKQVERRSVERVIAGKRRRKRRSGTKRRVRMAGSPRRRTVGKSGSGNLLLGLVIGAGALYFLTKESGTTQSSSLPPVIQTGNLTRDNQAQQIVSYAMAAGVAISAIASLINALNTSSDSTVSNVYDKVNTTGSLYDLGLPGYDLVA